MKRNPELSFLKNKDDIMLARRIFSVLLITQILWTQNQDNTF